MPHATSPGACLGTLMLMLFIPSSRLIADDDAKFQIDVPQKVLVTWAKGGEWCVDLVSANSREFCVKLEGYKTPVKYKAEAVKVIQTANDLYTYNSEKATFESGRKSDGEREKGPAFDRPQRAVLQLKLGREINGELVYLSSKTVWFKSDSASWFEVYKPGQVGSIKTGDDILTYNPDKTAFESSRAKAEEPTSGLRIDRPQLAAMRLEDGQEVRGELMLLTGKSVWFKSNRSTSVGVYEPKQVGSIKIGNDILRYNGGKGAFESGRKREQELAGGLLIDNAQSAIVTLANGDVSRGELVLLTSRIVWFKADDVPLFEVYNPNQILEITTPTDSYVHDPEKNVLCKKMIVELTPRHELEPLPEPKPAPVPQLPGTPPLADPFRPTGADVDPTARDRHPHADPTPTSPSTTDRREWIVLISALLVLCGAVGVCLFLASSRNERTRPTSSSPLNTSAVSNSTAHTPAAHSRLRRIAWAGAKAFVIGVATALGTAAGGWLCGVIGALTMVGLFSFASDS